MCFHLHPETLMTIPTQHNFSIQSMWGFWGVFLEGERGRVFVFGLDKFPFLLRKFLSEF